MVDDLSSKSAAKKSSISQSNQVTLTGEDPLVDWYIRHREDYCAVKTRLSKCRNILYHGRTKDATDMVRCSIINAIFSIRTEKSRHENAFVAWRNGGKSLTEAARDTLYGNRKAMQLQEQDLWSISQQVVTTLRSEEDPWQTVRYLMNTVDGLGVRKAPFVLAMCGVWEVMCFDSNVSRHFGIAPDKDLSLDDYQQLCDEACQSVDIEEPPFVIQYIAYDFERGEHARHMPFFNAVGIE